MYKQTSCRSDWLSEVITKKSIYLCNTKKKGFLKQELVGKKALAERYYFCCFGGKGETIVDIALKRYPDS